MRPQAIRHGVLADARREPTAEVVRLRPRGTAWLAAAAAVVVLVGGATMWRVTRGGGAAQPIASVATCRHTAGCHVVVLLAGDSSPASVLVNGKAVTFVSASMPAPPLGYAWALWQVPRKGSPRLLTEFGIGNATSVLSVSYDDTAAFAVSKEKAGGTPMAPSAVVATGKTA